MTTKLYNPVRKLDPYINEDRVLRMAGQLRMQITLIRLNIPQFCQKEVIDQTHYQVLPRVHQASGQTNDAR